MRPAQYCFLPRGLGAAPHNRPKSASVRLHVCPASVRGSGAHCMSRNSCAAHTQKDATNGFLDGGRHLALSRLGCHDAWRGSAEGASADHGWTRGHTGRREPFWPVFLPGQKPLCDFALCKARFPAIFARHSGLAEDDCFRLGRVHCTLPGIQAEDGPPQSCPVVPRHPPRRSAGEIGGMFL